MRIIVIALFLIASISSTLPLLAPFIGLGTGENYFFYKAAGIARKYHLAYSLALFFAAALLAMRLAIRKHLISSAHYLTERCRRALSATVEKTRGMIVGLKDWRNVCLLISAIIVVCVMAEISARVFIYWKHSGPKDSVIFTDIAFFSETIPAPGYGSYRPDITVNRFVFNVRHMLGHKSTFKINNYGLPSQNDYAIERSPGSKEYRIAILGDSLAASLPSDVTWADQLQERMQGDGELRRKLNVDQIKVLNFGQSGAGFRDFIRIYCYVAKEFSPNLLVTSFITDDLYRTHDIYNIVNNDSRNVTCDQIVADLSAKQGSRFHHQIAITSNVELILHHCSNLPFSLTNDTCIPANSYVAPQTIALDAKRMLTAREKARETYLLHRILLGSTIWLPALFKKGNVDLSYYGKQSIRTKDNGVALGNGTDFVAFMSRQQHKNVMLLCPVHSELAQKKSRNWPGNLSLISKNSERLPSIISCQMS
jgi:hypothetical protein|tara:strand:+ start:285 stop:1727 length:1443 start_codon:yes stop_codon:yes gene_type:complete